MASWTMICPQQVVFDQGFGSSEPLLRATPGVNASLCIHRNESSEPPSSFIIQSVASGSRTIVNYNESVPGPPRRSPPGQDQRQLKIINEF
jgi:hypothetical protein